MANNNIIEFYGPITLESGFTGINEAAKEFFKLCKEFKVSLDMSGKALVFTGEYKGLEISFQTEKILEAVVLDNGYSRLTTVCGDIYNLWDENKSRLNNGYKNPVPDLNPEWYKKELKVMGRETFLIKIAKTLENMFGLEKEEAKELASKYILFLERS